ncbi:MAG: hypothetical protein JXB23_12810 [Candidatus Aminicenantes bacterium]|nr:hypothetical protein [Candidatus Aminicenantes bacterium]
MKKVLIAAGIFALIAFSFFNFRLFQKGRRISQGKEIKALLVYTSTFEKDYAHLLKAYISICEEEGIPHEGLTAHLLLSLPAGDVVRTHPVIIFPDGVARNLPLELGIWVKEYLRQGGNVLIAYDPGTVDAKGAFRKEALFSDITGINYITYDLFRDKAYTLGNIKFLDETRSAFFQVPYGKTAEGLLLGGYAYGKLEYPIARNEFMQSIDAKDIFAMAITQDGEEFPAIVMRRYGKGNVLYVNLPLGHLKCFSDDFPLRAVLRTFLFEVVKMPHILNTPFGKGGLVINWHIDANVDWKSILYMLGEGYLTKDIRYSLHITAGDYRDKQGDGLGFDACGQGKSYLELIKHYGSFGSHGGWAHNWFSGNIEKGAFNKKEIFEYIKKNNECLESIVDYKIVEYAAPNGTHPQPVTTEVLEDLGFIAYYYTGDTGSSPNRTFFNGVKLSDRIIAFPILTFGKAASFYEMERNGYTEEEVREWLTRTTNYVIRNRTVRLIYSHPYDIPEYPDALMSFLEYAKQKQIDGNLHIDTMSQFANFLLKFLKTEYRFMPENNRLSISLSNPEGLEGIAIAVPKDGYQKPYGQALSIEEDGTFYYMTVMQKCKNRTISLNVQE